MNRLFTYKPITVKFKPKYTYTVMPNIWQTWATMSKPVKTNRLS